MRLTAESVQPTTEWAYDVDRGELLAVWQTGWATASVGLDEAALWVLFAAIPSRAWLRA